MISTGFRRRPPALPAETIGLGFLVVGVGLAAMIGLSIRVVRTYD